MQIWVDYYVCIQSISFGPSLLPLERRPLEPTRGISRTDNGKRVTASYVVARWKAATDVKRAVPLSRAVPLLTFNDVYRHGCPGDKRFWYLHPLDTRAALPFRCFYWRYAGERYQETFVRIAADGSRFDEDICSSCPTILLPFGYVLVCETRGKKKASYESVDKRSHWTGRCTMSGEFRNSFLDTFLTMRSLRLWRILITNLKSVFHRRSTFWIRLNDEGHTIASTQFK